MLRRQEVDVLCVVLGTPCPETTQAFSPSTVSKWASVFGLTPGQPYGVIHGHDLREKECRERVLAEVQNRKPRLVVLLFGSSLPSSPAARFSTQWMRDMLDSKVMLRFAIKVAQVQVRAGRFFFFASHVPEPLWHDRTVGPLLALREVVPFELEACRARILCNSEAIRSRLEPLAHHHFGEDGAGAVSDILCQAVCRGLAAELERLTIGQVKYHVFESKNCVGLRPPRLTSGRLRRS